MRKSIELGRAVLSTSTTKFELWLRTLITVSSQQQYTNLEQRDATSILGLLSSGEVWVGRGNGLYIELVLTLKGQPLADEQLQQLSEALLEAPAWAQLNLKPSLPCDAAHEPGKLRVMVNHSGESATFAARSRHRVLSNTPAADVRPPEGVPIFSLDSVVFCMDVLELVPRKTTPTAKRLKTSTTSNNLSQSNNNQYVDDADHGFTDTFVSHPNVMFPSLLTSSTLKRPRPLVSPAERTATSPITLPNEVLIGPRLDSQACETQETHVPPAGVERTSMLTLIDGALRLSVLSSINTKMSPGIKVKANTFGPGLADIAPTLWKAGYLVSLSQRAHLLPTITRSLRQPEATARTTSISLKQKLSALTAQLPSLQPPVHIQGPESRGILDKGRSPSSIGAQLWLHLQKHTPCKPATSLQPFLTAELQSIPLPDHVLEEPSVGNWPSSVGPDRSGASDVDQGLEGCLAATAACDGFSSRLHFLGAVATCESILAVSDDELLLGDECFEDANLLASCSSEVS